MKTFNEEWEAARRQEAWLHLIADLVLVLGVLALYWVLFA